MIEKFDPRIFKRGSHVRQCANVPTNGAIGALHSANGVDVDAGRLGQIFLLPTEQRPRGADLAIVIQAHGGFLGYGDQKYLLTKPGTIWCL